MFFILANTLGRLSVPSHALALIALVGGLLLLTRFRRAGRRILIGCLVVLVVVGAWPVGGALVYVLESRFPAWTGTGAPDGIVVLGGPIPIRASLLRGHPVVRSGAERLTEIPALAKRFPNARIVFSGGNPNLVAGGPPEAQFAVPLLQSFGIAPERIVAEDRSRNTRRERSLHQGPGQSKARRALAPGHVRRAHAARGRRVPQGRLPGRALSGRLAERSQSVLAMAAAVAVIPGALGRARRRRQGMDRARRLLAGRLFVGTVPRSRRQPSAGPAQPIDTLTVRPGPASLSKRTIVAWISSDAIVGNC